MEQGPESLSPPCSAGGWYGSCSLPGPLHPGPPFPHSLLCASVPVVLWLIRPWRCRASSGACGGRAGPGRGGRPGLFLSPSRVALFGPSPPHSSSRLQKSPESLWAQSQPRLVEKQKSPFCLTPDWALSGAGVWARPGCTGKNVPWVASTQQGPQEVHPRSLAPSPVPDTGVSGGTQDLSEQGCQVGGNP